MLQISSLSDDLLRAKQIGTSQTERADNLEEQSGCNLLREKVNDLLRTGAQKDENQLEEKETVSTAAVQTDDALKAC